MKKVLFCGLRGQKGAVATASSHVFFLEKVLKYDLVVRSVQ